MRQLLEDNQRAQGRDWSAAALCFTFSGSTNNTPPTAFFDAYTPREEKMPRQKMKCRCEGVDDGALGVKVEV